MLLEQHTETVTVFVILKYKAILIEYNNSNKADDK